MKTIFAICTLLVFTLSPMYANHDVVVDHSKQTVTLVANFISPAPIEKCMYHAAELWNKQSGKKTCMVAIHGKNVAYRIHFRLVVNQNPLSDTAVNIISVLPINHQFLQAKTSISNNGMEIVSKPIALTDGKFIAVCCSHKNNKYVLAHEMGHALGLKHQGTKSCCSFNADDITIFQLEESVRQLASQTQAGQTRKYIEIGQSMNDFVGQQL
jgi:Metallo-peptidase family M12